MGWGSHYAYEDVRNKYPINNNFGAMEIGACRKE